VAAATYSFEFLRELARLQGIEPTDADLAAVQTFLTNILPALADLERALPADVVPVGERVPAA
jgi:hypothetical protein